MLLLFPVLVLVAALLTFPAFHYSRRARTESWWLPFAAAPGLVVWAGLAMLGVGPQSLGNLVEVLWLTGAAVVLAYIKVFVVDRGRGSAVRSTYAVVAVLAAAAVALRAFTPLLPE